MIKKFILPFFFLLALTVQAQQATSSPYSYYGIGDVRFKGTVENRLMGGLSVFPDSIHVNIQNPASYASLLLTTYTVGGSFNATKLKTASKSEKAQRSTLDYMAVGIPLGKSGLGFGLIPYSAVGYRIGNVDADQTKHRYEGSGGLNKVFVGYGYKIRKNFSIGADLQYNFGRIETTNIKKLVIAQYGTKELNTSDLSGITLNLGLQYQRKINAKLDAYGSFTYAPETSLKSKNSRIISSVVYTDFLTSDKDRMGELLYQTTLKSPSKISFGAGLGQNKKWMVGAEVTLQQYSKFGNRYNDLTNVTYKNAVKYSFGGYYIPNYTSFSSYIDKVTYRAGFRYETTGMVINSESIRDYALTAGFGLPLGGAFSNLNLGLEYGRKGTAKALLVQEDYTNVVISLSMNDRWFVKRKYE
jgi:hypothetical protein